MACHSEKPDLIDEPAAKKRRLAPAASLSTQVVQSSFTEVLERLKEEAKDGQAGECALHSQRFQIKTSADVEGGSDCWSRPPLKPLDPRKDSISRQCAVCL